MRVLYYDCFCGISGDMNLGALIDLGVDEEYLIKEISKLKLDSEYEIQIKKDIKNGIMGTKVDVILKNQHNNDHHHVHQAQQTEDEHYHGSELHHTHNEESVLHDYHEVGNDNHEEHSHIHYEVAEQNHQAEDEHSHHHDHRNLKDIENIINRSDLSETVKKTSLHMFMKVAEAEAEVHGKSLYEVHFHEVGAIDSIIDIVGAAVALDYLKVDKIIASTVQVGGGFVKCAHGVIPVPAPATVKILKGIPIKSGIVSFETTTPTGAAILASNVEEFTDKIEFSIDKIGYGLGTRDLEIPNVLRVYLGKEESKEEIEEQYILETNIDDMNPELYGYVEEKLFHRGALDVFKTPIIMKKGRPAIKLSILVNAKKEKDVLEVIFKETTSIGVRKFKVEKIMLHREFSKVKTSYGEVNVKNSYYEGELVKYKAEYEDCKRIAEENNLPIAKVYRDIHKAIEENNHL
ncbi:nickel pincer cofactor biosynthesis protein LarC [Clostridium pasteurianum]|uniref:Pyridinium-3,5-bisthiocarboxylic acid mononucleotide nickel insertion protein n=1 Tax=Clostridium pasteurianum BC1 TaxID=86416 RepID=R4K832_CLOPA|nr:nickel pincer cofactor biosynthesis protein LarC [Clostridium pasteurianum]AGK95800.1 TIGR00299 family protein [Clostridium pasteurianum BC1]